MQLRLCQAGVEGQRASALGAISLLASLLCAFVTVLGSFSFFKFIYLNVCFVHLLCALLHAVPVEAKRVSDA